MTLKDGALTWAAEGFEVFPCGEDKAPLVRDGFKAASRDAQQVAEWWDRWPDALIGAPVPEGIVVIDMDPRNGGREALGELHRQGFRLPATRRAATRGGGFHLWYAHRGERYRKQLAQGVDVKAHGRGYIIVPPSPGYVWRDMRPPARLPSWVEDIIVKPDEPVRSNAPASGPSYFQGVEEGTRYGLRARDSELAELALVQEGGRNDALNRVAFNLAQLVAGGELDGDTTRDKLSLVAERIGLDSEEAEATIASGWEAGLQEPREAPEKPSPAADVAPPLSVPRRGHSGTTAEAEGRFWTRWDVDEPPPPFYLHPVLPKNAYVLVYGPTEASKSMVWAGMLSDASHHGIRSTIYSLENPRHVDRDRLRRLGPDPNNLRISHEPLDLGSEDDVEALIKRERDFDSKVILIDTYSHAFHSHRSDDGNAKAIAFAVVVRYIMSELNEQGLSVVVVDHTGYMNPEEPRDASAKRQQVDVAIQMSKLDDWRPNAERVRFGMTNRKAARFANPFDMVGYIVGRRGEPLSIEWQGTLGGWTP